MLIITRKPGEKIRIGQDIVVCVWPEGKRIKVGIEAPAHVNIARAELPEELPDDKPDDAQL